MENQFQEILVELEVWLSSVTIITMSTVVFHTLSSDLLQGLHLQQQLSVSSSSWESWQDRGQPNCLHQFLYSNKIYFLSAPLEEIDTVCILLDLCIVFFAEKQ